MRNVNWTAIALGGGLLLLVLLIAYFATSRKAEQDKLTNALVTTTTAPTHEKWCSSNATYDLIKRELFRRAAQLRGSDQAAYEKLAGYAVVRMENPAMVSEDSGTGTVNCSGSLFLDLPPGVAVQGERRSLMADLDYTVDANGNVTLANAGVIVASLATLGRATESGPETTETSNEAGQQLELNGVNPEAPPTAQVPQPSH